MMFKRKQQLQAEATRQAPQIHRNTGDALQSKSVTKETHSGEQHRLFKVNMVKLLHSKHNYAHHFSSLYVLL